MKAIIIYFSRGDENYFGGNLDYVEKGNNEVLKDFIKNILSCDEFKVEPLKPYPRDYKECLEVTKAEKDNNIYPPLKQYLTDVDDYDVVFVGSPVYWNTMPMPMFSALKALNLNNKVVMPFITHEGSGAAEIIADLRNLFPNAIIKEPLVLYGSEVKISSNKVLMWINNSLKEYR